MSDPPDNLIGRCPAPIHAPAIVHRSGGIDAKVLNACGHCGEQIVRVAGVWIAVPPMEADRLRRFVSAAPKPTEER